MSKKTPIAKNNDAAMGASSLTPDTVNADNNPQRVIDMRELGGTGLKRFGGFLYEDFLPELNGQSAVRIYKEMSENDPTIASFLFAITMLIRRVKWFAVSPSDKPGDKEATEFLETCMNDMSHTWIDLIAEILTMLPYGYDVQEIVYKQRCGDNADPSKRSKYNDGRIGWRKMPTRSQDSVYRWDFDDHGGIRGVEQMAPPKYLRVTIPIEKMLLFRTTIAKNNPEGKSMLRACYRPWYIKKNIENIEAIGIERDLAGLPIAYVPPEMLSPNASVETKTTLAAIKQVVVNVRRNSEEGMVLPIQYDPIHGKPIFDFKLLSTGGARQFDTTAIINRWDQRIAMTALADFILLGQDKVGSFALASSKTNLFSTAIGAILDIIADVFNRFAIPRLFALNDFKISDYPTLKHGDLGSVDLNELGNYITKLAQAGMPLFPNDELEKHLLEIAGMPPPPAEDQGPGAIPVEMPAGIDGNTKVIPDNRAGPDSNGSEKNNIENETDATRALEAPPIQPRKPDFV